MLLQAPLELTFKVSSFRKIPNPYINSDEGDKDPAMYTAICDVMDLPGNIPMETNPREQKMTTNVAKKIKNSLLDAGALNFYLLNRGLLLSAKSVRHNTYSNEVTVVFEDFEVHGDVDGGHTYKTILENRANLAPGQQYVKVELLTGVEGIFQSLAAARNTSVQVQDKSIAELENRFDIIKDTLAGQPYMKENRVFFKENDDGDIDVSDLLAVLNMFNIDRYQGTESFPVNSYSSKKKCIDLYIEDHKRYGASGDNPYVKMKPVMADFFRLYDQIEVSMNRFYRVKSPNGRYGATKGVQVPKNGQIFLSRYFQNPLEASSPNGFLYPILGAFRALLEHQGGVYGWKKDPFALLEVVGPELVESTVSMSRSLGNNPQSVGKESNIWKTLYMIVGFAAIS